MRLTCPNCGAQYEVGDDVIPPGGRDVQCSACGHTWLQLSIEELSEKDEDTPSTAVPVVEDEDGWPADIPPAPVAPPASPGARTRRKALDDSVLAVLREEADREKIRRQAEGTAIETQGDLGLPEPLPPAEVQAPPVVTDAADEAEVVSRASRRDLLPDIEEINSTLRATSERRGEGGALDAPPTARERRSSFRRGFLGSLGVMVLLLLPYIFAGDIAHRVPGAAPILAGYAHSIDSFRIWLDETMKSTTQSLQNQNGP